MMDEESVRESFARFGLKPDASMHEVEQSFRELRNLYSKQTLATYSLMGDGDDHQQRLESLQLAFDQILQARLITPAVVKESKATPCEKIKTVSEPRIVVVDADPETSPGLFLQQMREARGLSLRDVSERTKIGIGYLRDIEEHRFENLPVAVYVRGFLNAFSRTVDVADARVLIDSFMEQYKNR